MASVDGVAAALPETLRRAGERMPRRTAIGLVTGIVAILVVGAASYRTLANSSASASELERTLEVLRQAEGALASLRDAETGQRGFLLTGKNEYLWPYEQALPRLPQALATLRRLVSDDPPQRERIEKLEPLIRAKLAELAETIELRRSGDPVGAMRVVKTDAGRRTMRRIRGIFEGFIGREEQELARRRATDVEASRQLFATVLVGITVLLGLMLLTSVYAMRDFAARAEAENAARERETREREARRLVEAGAAERDRLIDALARSNRDLDQFAYVASHDLKAPLRGLANLSDWIQEDLGEAATSDIREKLDLMRGRVHRLEGLIDGILDYSRAGRVKHDPEEVDVAAVVREASELLGVPESGISVEVVTPLPCLHTMRVPLQQVFLNLIGNALKHGAGGGRIEVGADEQASHWDFFVRDFGPGIEPQYHERIWGVFQTLESRDKVEGTGIGLAVVRKIAESRDGRAWVESRPGEGATFHFTWPKREP